jgi:hypothetical protein
MAYVSGMHRGKDDLDYNLINILIKT